MWLFAAARPAPSEEDAMGVPVTRADGEQAAVSPSTVPDGRPAADAAVPVDQWTPVVASTLNTGAAPVRGTDGRLHVVYELQLTNAKPVPATLHEIQVVDADQPDRVLARYADNDLAGRLRELTGQTSAESMEIAPFVSRLVLVELSFAAPEEVAAALTHRFLLTGAAVTGGNTPQPQDYTAAPYRLAGIPPVLGPPLAGDRWVVSNGCCDPDGVHRATALPVNRHLAATQRFAIDYIRMDEERRLVDGDPADVRSHPAYGADVLAVADGTVVDTLNTLEDQLPGALPDPSTINLGNVDGNHVVLDLGNGHFAFYAHLQKSSVTVKPGDRVHRGEVLGRLGNTGNTSAPHLHFHLMDGPSVLGSDGLTYTYEAFRLAGHVAGGASTAERVSSDSLLSSPEPRRDQFPLDLDIVEFAT